MSITSIILNAEVREWTTTEEANILHHPDFHENDESGVTFLEDSYLGSQVGDRLSPISDNLYRITWADDLHTEYGEVTVFSNLRQALDLFFNHK